MLERVDGLFCFVLLVVAGGLGPEGTVSAPPEPRLPGSSAAQLAAAELLDRAIAYHDPDGIWRRSSYRLVISSARPDGSITESTIIIDNGAGAYTRQWERDGESLEAVVRGDDCTLRIGGAEVPTAGEVADAGLSCDALRRRRNYDTYLYGLPMKLLDAGTNLDPQVGDASFEGRSVHVLRVTYDPEVGSDTWYFYLDPDSFRLVGYRFYHDEAVNDGEYIILSDEVTAGSVRLPKVRSWYVNADGRHLGTDTVVSLERLDR